MAGRKASKQKILKAIKNSNGIIAVIARRLCVNWHTAWVYVREFEETKEAYEDECNRILDDSETVVLKSINNGNVETAKWYLIHKGKKRGYGLPNVIEKKVETNNDDVLKIQFVDNIGKENKEEVKA